MSQSGEDERRAALFLASFPDTVRAMFGDRPPRPEVMAAVGRAPGALSDYS